MPPHKKRRIMNKDRREEEEEEEEEGVAEEGEMYSKKVDGQAAGMKVASRGHCVTLLPVWHQ